MFQALIILFAFATIAVVYIWFLVGLAFVVVIFVILYKIFRKAIRQFKRLDNTTRYLKQYKLYTYFPICLVIKKNTKLYNAQNQISKISNNIVSVQVFFLFQSLPHKFHANSLIAFQARLRNRLNGRDKYSVYFCTCAFVWRYLLFSFSLQWNFWNYTVNYWYYFYKTIVVHVLLLTDRLGTHTSHQLYRV